MSAHLRLIRVSLVLIFVLPGCGRASLRYLAQVARWPVAADSTARHFASQIDRGVQFSPRFALYLHSLDVDSLSREGCSFWSCQTKTASRTRTS